MMPSSEGSSIAFSMDVVQKQNEDVDSTEEMSILAINKSMHW